MTRHILGVDLGGSSIKAVLVHEPGTILCRRNVDFPAGQDLAWASMIRDLIHPMEAECNVRVSAMGLSAPGLVADNGRSISFMPGRLSGLEGLDWTDFLKFPVPVPVLNDAHAALLGEVSLGAAAGLKNVMMLTLGTGVGGAALVDGQLLRGHLGRAGHLGHICLDPHGPPDVTRTPGSLEYEIGNYSIRERSGGHFESTHELIGAYRSGDQAAASIWLRSVEALACAIASLINVLDPEAVIIGGGIARAGDCLFAPLLKFLDQVEWRPGGRRVSIRPAALGEFAGALGAAFWAGRGKGAL